MGETLQIETGVPIPRRVWSPGRGRPSSAREAFRRMAVGDSAVEPLRQGETRKRAQSRVSMALREEVRQRGGGYTTHAVEGGIRFWRTKEPDHA